MKLALLLITCLALLFVVAAPAAAPALIAGASLLFALPAVAGVYAVRDASLEVTKALPNGAATIATGGIDLGHSANGDHLARCELEIQAPALATADLPDTETMIYDVYHDDASDFSSEALLYDNVITQTGAGGAGAAAITDSVPLPADVKRYIRVKATNSGAGDASDKSVTVGLKF